MNQVTEGWVKVQVRKYEQTQCGPGIHFFELHKLVDSESAFHAGCVMRGVGAQVNGRRILHDASSVKDATSCVGGRSFCICFPVEF